MATLTKPYLHPSRIDLPENTRSKTVDLLNKTLASVLDLKTQVKQAHWNVKGKDFYQLHELFDQMSIEVEESVDLVAERVTTLGGTALGTARVAAKQSVLDEYPHDIFKGQEHIQALAERYAAFGHHVREAIETTQELGDATTADLYTQLSRNIDMRLWFLEAHLQG